MAEKQDNTGEISNDYIEALSKYTQVFKNCRYDQLSITSDPRVFTSGAHVVPDKYRSYGTYRKDIIAESSLIKINETYNDEDSIITDLYNTESTSNTYKFPGCVLSKKFSCNGSELTLEDLFAEYGYDYLKAYDTSLRASYDILNASDPSLVIDNTDVSFYFDIVSTTNTSYVEGSYSILPIGSTFINYDEPYITENGNKAYNTETVSYDGTYVPTVKEVLDGSLYIVLKSGKLSPRKIYFNNTYLPTLFLNDDVYTNHSDWYVLNDLLTLKLCDVMTFEKFGCSINWKEPIIMNSLLYIRNNCEQWTSNYLLLTFYYAYYTVGSGSNSKKYMLGEANKCSSDIKKFDSITTSAPYFENFNNTETGTITATNNTDITVHFAVGIAAVFYGYSLNEPSSTDTYSLGWYQIESSGSEGGETPTVTTLYISLVDNAIGSYTYSNGSYTINVLVNISVTSTDISKDFVLALSLSDSSNNNVIGPISVTVSKSEFNENNTKTLTLQFTTDKVDYISNVSYVKLCESATSININLNDFSIQTDKVSITLMEVEEWIDLGLKSGKLWNNRNYGANKSYEKGDWCNVLYHVIATDYFINGNTDNVPSYDDILELITQCTWSFIVINGTLCAKVIGPNGNFIILPMVGYYNYIYNKNSGMYERGNNNMESTNGFYLTKTHSSNPYQYSTDDGDTDLNNILSNDNKYLYYYLNINKSYRTTSDGSPGRYYQLRFCKAKS